MGFAHGTNDAQKTMGIIALALIGAEASGTLDSLPHNGGVVTMLAVCGSTLSKSYFDIVMVAIVSAILALVAVIVLGTMFGSF